jgi:glycosyltransferase involved in cell wall biosynthesis
LRDRLGIPPERPLVVTLARIAAIKGLPTMARALGSLPNVWWLLAGPDERDGTLTAVRRALADVGAADRAVVLPGGLWGDDKRAALAEADVVCLPSEYESFGSAAVEAAAVGVPVVVTDGCGGAELFTDAGPWSVVPTADPDAIATAIDALRGSDRSDQHASELRHLLAWETVAARQVRIYAAAVDQRAD